MNTLGTLWLLGAQYEFNSIPEGTGDVSQGQPNQL
jgi:hypothetical protein